MGGGVYWSVWESWKTLHIYRHTIKQLHKGNGRAEGV